MMQVAPPAGPDFNFLIDQIVPLIGILGIAGAVTVSIKWIMQSPVGAALAERIRHGRVRRGEPVALGGGADARLAALEDHLEALQAQVGELLERQDFTERVLAEKRGTPQLGRGQ
ncbi:MAG TPA: hypothetical protein VI160_09030 [Gemmatimonadales bacterium]